MGDGVQSRQEVVLGGDQFQFALLDPPPLAAKLDAAAEGLGVDLRPVERHLGGGRLVGRPDQPPVGRRQAHDVAETGLGFVEALQGRLDGAAEEEVLFAGLGLLVGLAAGGADDIEGVNLPPGLQGAVAPDHGRVEIAVGEIEFPVGLLHVVDQVPHLGLEIGQGDVGVDPREQHAVVDAGGGAGTGNFD